MRYAGCNGVLSGLRFGSGNRLPIVLQTEATECALACIAMIAAFHGYDIDLLALRRRASVSLTGTDLRHVINIAYRLGLDSRPLRAHLDHLSTLRMPCILHWDFKHFVVLKQVRHDGIVIHDPASGVRRVTRAETSRHFTGIALELWPSAKFRRAKVREQISVSRLFGRSPGLAPALLQVLTIAAVLEVLLITGPLYMQWVLDDVLTGDADQLLTALGIGFLLLTGFEAAISCVRSWCIVRISAMMSIQWISNLMGHLLRLPLEFFEKRHIGDVVSRFASVQAIQKTFSTQFVESILDGLMSVLTVILMALFSGRLTVLVIAGFSFYCALRLFAFGALRRATEEQLVCAARQQSDLLESIRGIQAIKLANQEESRCARYGNAIVETTNRDIIVQRLSITFQTGNELILGLVRVALVWCAATMVLDRRFSVGMLVAFVAYADQFGRRGAAFVDRLNEFRMLGLHAERVADIALTAQEADLEGIHGELKIEGRIEIRNLKFRYGDQEPWIIEDLNLLLEPGETVAVAAPSGSGKTTLAKLVLGLLVPNEGQILVDGIDIRKGGLKQYREKIAAVMQDDQLFCGSIEDNISLSDPDGTTERVKSAAVLARIHDEIVAMPMGYQTLVGDMGSSLSGGQRQRILLARALYRNPKFLVLDEATSHLDVPREREINALLRGMRITRLVFAHRPETLSSADRVVVLSRGRGAVDVVRAAAQDRL